MSDLAGRTLLLLEQGVDAPANAATPVANVALQPLITGGGMVLVSLELTGSAGAVLSRNFYWRGRDPAAYRALNALAPAALSLQTRIGAREDTDQPIRIALTNTGTSPALAIKLTVLDKVGARVLPAYFEENYISLLPGEQRTVIVRVPAGTKPAAIGLRGWNAAETRIVLGPR